MNDCTDVCEVVMDVLIGLGYDIKTDEGDEDHADILSAFCKYSQSYTDLLNACKIAIKFLDSMATPITGFQQENRRAFRKIVADSITKAESKQANEPERTG